MSSPSKTPTSLCDDLECWMTNLPEDFKNVPLINLAIPGSHDSFTSTITSSSRISPDAEPFVQNLKCLGPLLGVVVSRWARTQDHDITRQLSSGIRYFDLRISTKEGTEQLYFVHGQYSVDVVSVLNEIENFLDAHPKEVVILDCQHFYDFNKGDHGRLMQLLKATFGRKKLLPYAYKMDHITLNYMTRQHRYQVIVVYRLDAARYHEPFFWPSACFPNPWPETDNVEELIAKLNSGISERSPKTGFVSQCVLTPTNFFIFRHLFQTLKNTCVLPLEKVKYQWLQEQAPGPRGVNIIIADFTNLNGEKFCREVITLNEKLFGNNVK